MRKRPEIPEDVFFDVRPDDESSAEESEDVPAGQREPEPEAEAAPEERGDVLRKSMEDTAPERPEQPEAPPEDRGETRNDSETTRLGRPPAQEGPKDAVTLYLTEPVAHMLEEVKFRLLTEYDVKTSKSAIADFAIRNGLNDLQAAADDLRRD